MLNICRIVSVGLLLAGLSATASARQSSVRGYQPQDARVAATLPVYVVIDPATLRPEIAYGYQEMPALTGPNLSAGIGVGLAGTLIASAIINGAAYAKAKHLAQPPYHMLQQAQCDLAVGPSLGDRIAAALRANWPSATVTVVTLQPGQKLNAVLNGSQPRYVFGVTQSLAPDFSAVITSIDSEAYLPQAGGASAAHEPAWRDTLIGVSDQMPAIVGAKSKADIDAMIDAESARFVALDLDDRILKVNAAGPAFDRRERNQLAELLLEHDRMLKEAASDDWSPAGEAMRRASLLSAEHCQLLDASVQTSSAQAAQLLAALGAPLPALPPQSAPAAVEGPAAGVRQAYSMPGNIIVSQRYGDSVELGYRHSLLTE